MHRTKPSGRLLQYHGHVFRSLCTVVCVLLAGLSVTSAQDLEQLKEPVQVKFSGALQLSSNFYSVTGIPDRTSPFAWAISGSPTLQIGDVRFPFYLSFRNQRFGYGTPFNKFGVSPYYKWAKLHVGWRTMNFSPYSLQGKSFLGAGVELNPGKFRFSAFKGTIRNPFAQLDTIVYGARLVDTYKRKAQGVKIGYGTSKNSFDLFYLKVKDDISSFNDRPAPADYELDPADNLVIGTAFKFTFFERLVFQSNLNVSAYSDNQTLGEILFDNRFVSFINDIITFNNSTQVSMAGDVSLGLNFNNTRFALKYRRVEPQYRSLGISYIQTDVESFLGSGNFTLLKRRLMLFLQGGIERTNLRDLDYLGRKRLIGDARLQWIPSPAFQVMGQFANYQYETQDGLIELNDTLRVINVTQNTGLFMSYVRKNETWNYGASVNIQRQTIRDRSPILNLGMNITSIQSGLSLKLVYAPADLRMTPSIFYARYTLPDRLQERYGIGLNINKGFFDKTLRLGLGSRIARNDIDNLHNGRTLTVRLNASYQLIDKHTLNASINLLDKRSTLSPSFTEYRSSLSYGLRF